MSPFLPTPPEIQVPPIDIPTPSIPPADFTAIGAQFAAGVQKQGGLSSTAFNWLDIIPDIVGKILGAILALILRVVAYIMTLIFQVFNGASSGTDQVLAAAIGGMFDIPVAASSFVDVSNTSSRKAVADQIISQMFSKIAGASGMTAGSGIVPSQQGAIATLGLTTHAQIEAWLSGFLVEVVGAGQLETFAELKEAMEHGLALSRMARQAFSPLLKVGVHDPFLAYLNQLYRPAQLGAGELVREFLRGAIDQPTFDTAMGYHGYTAAQQAALVNIGRAHLSAGDLHQLYTLNQLTQSQVIDALMKQGYDQATAQSVFNVQDARFVAPLYRASLNAAIDAFVAGKIDAGGLQLYLNNSGLPTTEVALLTKLAQDKRAVNVPILSLGEGKQLVLQGLWTISEYSNLLKRHNYSLSDANDLELLLLAEVQSQSDAKAAKAAKATAAAAAAKAKAAAAQTKAAAAALAAQVKGVSIAAYESLVRDGIKTLADFSAFLTAKGLTTENVQALTADLQAKLAKAAAKTSITPTTPATPKAKHLSLAELEKLVKDGHLTMAEFQTDLENEGYAAADATALVELLTDEIAAAAAKAATVAATKANAAIKHANFSQLEKAARLGIVPVAQFQTDLATRGFAPEDVTLLVAELNNQIALDKAAAAKKAATSSTATTKGLTVGQLARAVRAGAATMADYQAALQAAHFDAASIAQLSALLQLQLDNDSHTLAASGKAAAKTAARGISLTQIERLVKLGVSPMSTYTAALQAAGTDATDTALLTTALQAQIAATKQTAAKVPTITALLASKGLSLANLESETVKGSLTMGQFQAALSGAGVSAADIATVTTLVSDEIANNQQAAALKAQAAAAAKAKGLNLAQEEAAVKAGVQTMAEFQVFVQNLGFNAHDTQVLVDTLTASSAYQKLVKAAAAAGSSTVP